MALTPRISSTGNLWPPPPRRRTVRRFLAEVLGPPPAPVDPWPALMDRLTSGQLPAAPPDVVDLWRRQLLGEDDY